MHAAVVLVAVTVGCAAAPRRDAVHRDEPVKTYVEPARELRAARQARSYNEPFAGAHTQFARTVFAGLVDSMRDRGVLAHDLRLDVAASAIAAVGARPSGAAAEHALRAVGVIESVGRIIEVPSGSTDDVVARLIASAAGPLLYANVRVGLSTPEHGERVVLVIVYSAGVTLAPIPRSLHLGESAELSGVLDDGFAAPQITIRNGRGAMAHAMVTATSTRTFRARVECAGVGIRWIAIEATGPDGPAVLVVFPVHCAEIPPDRYWVEPATSTANVQDAFAFEQRIAAIASRHRTARSLAPFAIDARATRAARDYAALLSREAHLAHDLGGTPMARLRAAGMNPALVAQSVMIVSDLATAAEILMNDDAYRENLEAPRLTHVGAGAVRRQNQWYVVLTYVRIPPPINVAAARAKLVAKLRTHERIAIDPDLQRAAQRLAAGLSIGWNRDSLWPGIKSEIPAATLHHESAVAAVVESSYELELFDLDEIRSDQGDRRMPRVIGLGVAQSARDGFHAGRIWVVVLSSGRRARH